MENEITNAIEALSDQKPVEETTDGTKTIEENSEDDLVDLDKPSDKQDYEVEQRTKSKSERTAERFKKLLSKLNQAEQKIKELEKQTSPKTEDEIQTKDKYDEFIEFELIAQKLNASPEEKIKAWKYAQTHKTLPFKDCFVLVRNKEGYIQNKTVGIANQELTKKPDLNKMPLNELEQIITKQFYQSNQ